MLKTTRAKKKSDETECGGIDSVMSKVKLSQWISWTVKLKMPIYIGGERGLEINVTL